MGKVKTDTADFNIIVRRVLCVDVAMRIVIEVILEPVDAELLIKILKHSSAEVVKKSTDGFFSEAEH